jgi:hypothetical protein
MALDLVRDARDKSVVLTHLLQVRGLFAANARGDVHQTIWVGCWAMGRTRR